MGRQARATIASPTSQIMHIFDSDSDRQSAWWRTLCKARLIHGRGDGAVPRSPPFCVRFVCWSRACPQVIYLSNAHRVLSMLQHSVKTHEAHWGLRGGHAA